MKLWSFRVLGLLPSAIHPASVSPLVGLLMSVMGFSGLAVSGLNMSGLNMSTTFEQRLLPGAAVYKSAQAATTERLTGFGNVALESPAFAVRWVDPDPRVAPRSRKKISRKKRKAQCRKWQKQLNKVRERQRNGYNIKQGERLRRKADILKLDLYRYCKRSSRLD